MDNPQVLKKAILAVLAEKGDFDEVLDHIEDMVPEDKQEEAKLAAIAVLVERGE